MSKPILKMHNRRKHPVCRLPFWGDRDGVKFKSFWSVPATGGYGGGCATGAALAHVYMKHIKENPSPCGVLQSIVISMAGLDDRLEDEFSALRGQIVGFFTTIEAYLNTANESLRFNVHRREYKEFLKAANDGLNYVEPVYPEE